MTKKDYINKLKDLSFTAGMNQKYHQHECTRYKKTDKRIRISVGVISLFGVISSLLSVSLGLLSLDITSAAISVIALAVAIVLNVHPSGENGDYHQGLLRRWCDLREDVDGQIWLVKEANSSKIPNDVYLRLRDLTTKKNRINSLEKSPNKELLNTCYEEENLARTGFRTQQEMDEYLQEKGMESRRKEPCPSRVPENTSTKKGKKRTDLLSLGINYSPS
jgi:hypothetical protein